MSAIRGKDTKPEMVVRSISHALGYRYRLHRRDLPGVPDLVFPKLRKVVNVHGCFWHMHGCRYGAVTPKTNTEFWQNKRSGNVTRDRKVLKCLRTLGWRVLIVWECETKDVTVLRGRLQKFLQTPDKNVKHGKR